MSAVDGRVLLLALALVVAVAFLRRALDYADRRVLSDVAPALDQPERIGSVVFQCRVCRHVTRETASDLDNYLTALETGACNDCRAVIEAHEKEWTA